MSSFADPTKETLEDNVILRLPPQLAARVRDLIRDNEKGAPLAGGVSLKPSVGTRRSLDAMI